jgi:hypothetical protein
MKLVTALLLFAAPLPLLHAQDLPRAKALEETAVRALLGKKSIITGKVTDAFESPKGLTFLNMEGGKFTVVVYQDHYDKFEGGSPARLYKGKTVEVTGEVFEFRNKSASKDDPGKLEIKLKTPDQIKVLTVAGDGPAADDKAEDKKAGSKQDKKEDKTGRKDAKDQKDAKPGETPREEPKPDATEKPERVDPKKFFK